MTNIRDNQAAGFKNQGGGGEYLRPHKQETYMTTPTPDKDGEMKDWLRSLGFFPSRGAAWMHNDIPGDVDLESARNIYEALYADKPQTDDTEPHHIVVTSLENKEYDIEHPSSCASTEHELDGGSYLTWACAEASALENYTDEQLLEGCPGPGRYELRYWYYKQPGGPWGPGEADAGIEIDYPQPAVADDEIVKEQTWKDLQAAAEENRNKRVVREAAEDAKNGLARVKGGSVADKELASLARFGDEFNNPNAVAGGDIELKDQVMNELLLLPDDTRHGAANITFDTIELALYVVRKVRESEQAIRTKYISVEAIEAAIGGEERRNYLTGYEYHQEEGRNELRRFLRDELNLGEDK